MAIWMTVALRLLSMAGLVMGAVTIWMSDQRFQSDAGRLNLAVFGVASVVGAVVVWGVSEVAARRVVDGSGAARRRTAGAVVAVALLAIAQLVFNVGPVYRFECVARASNGVRLVPPLEGLSLAELEDKVTAASDGCVVVEVSSGPSDPTAVVTSRFRNPHVVSDSFTLSVETGWRRG